MITNVVWEYATTNSATIKHNPPHPPPASFLSQSCAIQLAVFMLQSASHILFHFSDPTFPPNHRPTSSAAMQTLTSSAHTHISSPLFTTHLPSLALRMRAWTFSLEASAAFACADWATAAVNARAAVSSVKAAELRRGGGGGDASEGLLGDVSLQGAFGGGRRGRVWVEVLYVLHCACSCYALERWSQILQNFQLILFMVSSPPPPHQVRPSPRLCRRRARAHDSCNWRPARARTRAQTARGRVGLGVAGGCNRRVRSAVPVDDSGGSRVC